MLQTIETQQLPDAIALQERSGLSEQVIGAVLIARDQLSHAIRNHEDYFVSVDGPCPLTETPEITMAEAEQKVSNAAELAGYVALDRECFFKPRTNPADWSGLDTEGTAQRFAAHRVLSTLAERHANVAAEVSDRGQLVRYNMLTMAWIGGRNINNHQLVEDLALADPTIPIGVKNGLDGTIEQALKHVETIERLRDGHGAPAILIYRGGLNAMTPKESQETYMRAHEATEGKLFYDAAHGVEMAYDPDRIFGKSVAGQIKASEALIDLTRQGFAPLGKFAEASSIESIMDPHMPLDIALEHNLEIYAAKLG